MKCPKCGYQEDKVIDSRMSKEASSVRRRRECLQCSNRFTTLEEIVAGEMFVIKRDDSREEFNPQKIREGVNKACWKRPISVEQIDELMEQILQQIEKHAEREISSELIGNYIMGELENFDEVAYVRFASVYRQFKDIGQFINEIRMLNRKNK